MKKIQIYGPGCTRCTTLAETAQQAVKELQWDIPIEKVNDPALFSSAGIQLTPALVLDGRILLSGKIPSVEEIKNLLRRAEEETSDTQKNCCSGKKKEIEKNNENCGCEVKGGCCNDKQGTGWKKAIIWLAAILILLTVIKLINRGLKSPAAITPAIPTITQKGENETTR